MTDGVLIVDAQGVVQLVNPAAEKMFSISQTATIGKPLIEVVRHHQPVEMWQRCQTTGEAQRVDFEIGITDCTCKGSPLPSAQSILVAPCCFSRI